MNELERDMAVVAARLQSATVAVRSHDNRGAGSGVVWGPDTVVTNAHVALTSAVDIEFADGRTVTAGVERRDVDCDLATIRCPATSSAAPDLRDPVNLRAGEVLLAFGHPLGVRNVLSIGIAFGPHRPSVDRFVRADLRLAPGNSGGALADAEGRIVGINSMVAGGLALAIPTGEVLRFLGQTSPRVARLGVRLAPAELGGRARAFAVLAVEPGSPADRSGLLPGDILLTRNPAALAWADRVRILRGGAALDIALQRRSGGVGAAA